MPRSVDIVPNKIHFSFGGHDPEDVPLATRNLKRHLEQTFVAGKRIRNGYFDEMGDLSTTQERKTRRNFMKGRNFAEGYLFDYVISTMPDITEPGAQDFTVRGLSQILTQDNPIGARIDPTGFFHFNIFRTVDSVSPAFRTKVDFETHPDDEAKTISDLAANLSDHTKRIGVATDVGDIPGALEHQLGDLTHMAAIYHIRNPRLLSQFEGLLGFAKRERMTVREVARIGDGHDVMLADITPETYPLLSETNITTEYDEGRRVKRPYDYALEQVLAGEEPSEEDLIRVVVSPMLDYHLASTTPSRAVRTERINPLLARVSTSQIEAFLREFGNKSTDARVQIVGRFLASNMW